MLEQSWSKRGLTSYIASCAFSQSRQHGLFVTSGIRTNRCRHRFQLVWHCCALRNQHDQSLHAQRHCARSKKPSHGLGIRTLLAVQIARRSSMRRTAHATAYSQYTPCQACLHVSTAQQGDPPGRYGAVLLGFPSYTLDPIMSGNSISYYSYSCRAHILSPLRTFARHWLASATRPMCAQPPTTHNHHHRHHRHGYNSHCHNDSTKYYQHHYHHHAHGTWRAYDNSCANNHHHHSRSGDQGNDRQLCGVQRAQSPLWHVRKIW